MKYILMFLFLLGCQVSPEDNSFRGEYNHDTSQWPIKGVWHSENGMIEIDDRLSCDFDDVDSAVTISQKTIELKQSVCLLTTIMFYQSIPPYDKLDLLVNGKHVILWR